MARAEAGRQRNRRHVWVVEGELLRAVEIVTGLSDDKYSELVSGKLDDGQRVVTGLARTSRNRLAAARVRRVVAPHAPHTCGG